MATQRRRTCGGTSFRTWHRVHAVWLLTSSVMVILTNSTTRGLGNIRLFSIANTSTEYSMLSTLGTTSFWSSTTGDQHSGSIGQTVIAIGSQESCSWKQSCDLSLGRNGRILHDRSSRHSAQRPETR